MESVMDRDVRPHGELLFFDLETCRSSSEVGGWCPSSIARMGMAVGVVQEDESQAFYVYREGEAEKLVEHLQSARLVVGFNLYRFDYHVLRGCLGRSLPHIPTFDLLADLTDRLGHRVSLDSCVMATLGAKKPADGLQSLRWYREGRIDLVIDYCKQDVALTRQLFHFGCAHDSIRFRDKMGRIRDVRVDWRQRAWSVDDAGSR